MADDLQDFLEKQGVIIDTLKRVLINFKKLPKTNVTLTTARTRLANLQKYWEKILDLHAKINRAAKAEDRKKLPYFLQDEFLAAEDAYTEAVDYLQEVITNFVAPESPAGNTPADPTVDDEIQSSSTTLQRIPIPTFTGKFTEWPRFRHLFHSLVHSNKALTKIAKFHYLISSVAGPAATPLDGLNVSPENYDAAWKMLLEEYDNEKELIRAHLRTIIRLPDGKLETAAELKKLKDTVRVALINVANLGFQVDNWDLLVTIMSEKFGTETDAKWREHLGASKKSLSYKELSDFLNGRILSLPASKSVIPATINNSQKKSRSAVHNVSVQNCVNCNGAHGLANCERFRSLAVEQRRTLVQEKRACFNCLRSNHFTRNCPSKLRCMSCRRSHHTLLHLKGGRTTRDMGAPEPGAGDQGPQAGTTPSSVQEKATVAHIQPTLPSSLREDRGVMPTAWVDLHTTEGRRIPVRALLDQCSTLSFVSESFCRTLRTRRQRIDLTIHGVARMQRDGLRSRVTLGLSPRDRLSPMIPLTAQSTIVLPDITAYTAPRDLPIDTWPHLRGLELANPDPSSQHPIHMLIGLYLSVVFPSIIEAESPRVGPKDLPMAQKTVFRWVLSGPGDVAQPDLVEAHVSLCVNKSDTNTLLQLLGG